MTSINSPFRYPGGKFYARKLILERLHPHDVYIEPFAGGASIFFAKAKAITENWLNDVDEELVNCYIHIRDHVHELIKFLDGLPATKELHYYYKNQFSPQNDLERAGCWYYLNRTSYSGIMNKQNCYWGYGDKFSMRPENWGRHLLKCSQKLQDVRLTSLDFEDIINNAPDESFLFIDPPYFNADQDKFYTHSFSLEDHYRLEKILKNHAQRIKFLLTYDNASEIKLLYDWAINIETQEWNYTINRTDDQKTKSNQKGSRYRGQEFFITNYAIQNDSTMIQLPLWEDAS